MQKACHLCNYLYLFKIPLDTGEIYSLPAGAFQRLCGRAKKFLFTKNAHFTNNRNRRIYTG